MVIPAGFEPGITGLRVLRPIRLDEGTVWQLRRDSNPRSPDRQSGVIAIFTTELYRGVRTGIRTRTHHAPSASALHVPYGRLAPNQGFEPQPPESESGVLPLHQSGIW